MPKLYCNSKYWILGKVMWMTKRQSQKYKPLHSIYNLVDGLEQVTNGVMPKQAKDKWQKCKNAY